MTERALSLSRDQLDFEAWRKARDAGEVEWGELEAASAVSLSPEA
jgi:hypothetical protein